MKYILATLMAAVCLAGRAATINVAPTDDLAAIAENAQDGDELVLSAIR